MSCLGNPDFDFEGMRFLKQLGRYVKSMGSALSGFSFFLIRQDRLEPDALRECRPNRSFELDGLIES